MQTPRSILILGLVVLCAVLTFRLRGANPQVTPRYEYVTIRWAGLENTHIIRPGGEVEFIGTELRKLHKPDKADNRSFYLNCAMNGLTKDGYEFVGISNDDIVMKKSN
jgi:hypothetical protein